MCSLRRVFLVVVYSHLSQGYLASSNFLFLVLFDSRGSFSLFMVPSKKGKKNQYHDSLIFREACLADVSIFLIQTWKILHKHDNVKEGTWFTRSVDTAQRETRFSTCNMNLNSKLCNLDIRRNFFSLRVIKRWYSLPIVIKNATSLISFKNMYDKHISSM